MLKYLTQKTFKQDFWNNIILLPIDLALIFCSTFSGQNKTVYEIPFFLFSWIVIFALRRNFFLSQAEISAQIFVVFALMPIFIQFYKYNFDYYFGAISVILYVNILVFGAYVIERLLSDSPGCKLVRWLPAISLIILGFLAHQFSGNDPRQSLIFGPNIYYRIVGSIFLLNLVLVHDNYSGKKDKISFFSLLTTILCLIIALFIMIKTGSRGAAVVGCMLTISFLYTVLYIRLKWLRFANITIIFALCGLILKSSFSESIFDSRVFWFYDRGASSGSISARQGFWENLPSFFIKDNYLFGEGSDYIYSYPHNLYLDILYNGGLLPCVILLIFTIIYGILLCKGKLNRNWKILTLICSPIYIGSLFSGTIYNNYSVISLIFILPLFIQNKDQTISKIPPKNKIFL
ncbi:O-antigen ligase family protein [Nostoc sp.]|uniref:O-antigen ligase family protein n=1 Tax=Nostoc sp. TaxID=1180 RepID=UPI002FF67D42